MIHDPAIHDPTMHSLCRNYATMITLYRDNSWCHRKEKYKRVIQRPGFLGEEKMPDQRSCIFKKLFFYFLIYSDKDNIASISHWYVRKLFQHIVSVIVQSNPNEHDF